MAVVGSVVGERTHLQRMTALAEANRVRRHMAAVKRAVAAGEVTVDAVLVDPDCGSLSVAQLIRSIPGFSSVKTDLVLQKSGVSPGARVGRLTRRQRAAVVKWIAWFPAGRKALS